MTNYTDGELRLIANSGAYRESCLAAEVRMLRARLAECDSTERELIEALDAAPRGDLSDLRIWNSDYGRRIIRALRAWYDARKGVVGAVDSPVATGSGSTPAAESRAASPAPSLREQRRYEIARDVIARMHSYSVTGHEAETIACAAVIYADALLAALEVNTGARNG